MGINNVSAQQNVSSGEHSFNAIRHQSYTGVPTNRVDKTPSAGTVQIGTEKEGKSNKFKKAALAIVGTILAGVGIYALTKGKGKKVASGGPHKKHGPKRHMHAWCGAMKKDFADAGLLSKYYDFESWQLAMAARGNRKADYAEFRVFSLLSMEEKKAYFANCKK